MKTPSRRHAAAFTLIELMAVITIIILLAGLVVGGMGFVADRQAKEKAKTQIALLSKAIEEYKLDMGKYPGTADDTPTTGDVSEQLYQALFKDGYDYTNPATPPENWNKATRIYLPELDPRGANKQGWVDNTTATTPPANVKIKDPWGTAYKYRKGKNAQNPDFDLWSSGKDMQSDTNPEMSRPKNKDDIRNF